jgi:transcriptional regulator with XRE-family HTH domain
MLAVMSIDVQKKLGRQIRFLREEQKMSQDTLSALAGLSQTSLSLIENGEQLPKLNNLINIAKALNVKVYDLIKVID